MAGTVPSTQAAEPIPSRNEPDAPSYTYTYSYSYTYSKSPHQLGPPAKARLKKHAPSGNLSPRPFDFDSDTDTDSDSDTDTEFVRYLEGIRKVNGEARTVSGSLSVSVSNCIVAVQTPLGSKV